MSVRVRFAPSPTGALHIGGVRTALYNYLFAKKTGGTFILRIEDTDQGRYVPGAEEYILEALNWLGISPDEMPGKISRYAPYRQSERLSLYQKYAEQLIKEGKAYYAFDSGEQLDALRKDSESRGEAFLYGAKTRTNLLNSLTMSEDAVKQKLASGDAYVIRLKVTPDEVVSFDDIVRGTVSFQSNELDDKVLLKSDGFPTYHLANVIDDHEMAITHVIRGEEWLSSTAHHILLYRAFGWQESMPAFAHLPLIMKPDGKGKLSKRDGAKFDMPVFPLSWYENGEEAFKGFREAGFLPAALLNFLVLLGWHPEGDNELMSLDKMAKYFSLDRINNSGARFDYEKAKWFNQQYILHSPVDELLPEVSKILSMHNIQLDADHIKALIALMQERCTLIGDFYTSCTYLFNLPTEYDDKSLDKKWDSNSTALLVAINDILNTTSIFEADILHDNVHAYMDKNDIGPGQLFPLLRIAMTGTLKGPDLFKTIAFLGKNESMERINKLISYKSMG